MSMSMLTVLQFIMVLAAYMSVTLLLPWIALHKRFSTIGSTAVRFMAYFMIGNFYVMNLVFLLQLLHISCRLTLAIGTLIPFLAGIYRDKGRFLPSLERRLEQVKLILGGEIGKKTLVLRIERKLRGLSSGILGRRVARHGLDLLLTTGVISLVCYMYGSNMVLVYGYCSSDMVVHHHWISEMMHNNIFVDGVYPFGMHCVLYYLDAVFSIPGYVLFRVFGLVQTLMIHLILLAFLKVLCRSRFAAYAGIVLYMLSDRLYEYTYYRYYATLPQEFGMLFILPAAYFAIAFLREKKVKDSWLSRLYLVLFAISVSMTLAVHFYDTIIAGLFCVGIAAGFCFRCFRWRYLNRIAAAGIAGILIAVLPMGAAYVSGTPLQASLNWGMSLFSSEGTEAAADVNADKEESSVEVSAQEEKKEPSSPEKSLTLRVKELYHAVVKQLQYYVVKYDARMPHFMLGSIGLLVLLGILWFVLRRSEYGAVLVSAGVFMMLLTVLQAADVLGIPQVVEISRLATCYTYGMAVVWGLCLDAVLLLLLRGERLMDMGALGCLMAVCIITGLTGIRVPAHLTAYEKNGAMTCLANIIRENKGGDTWTICSANDERWMVDEYAHGYHYELIDFLRKMGEMDGQTSVTIPSSNVYFFIEKIPGVYADRINRDRPERIVSVEGAQEPLSAKPGLVPYTGDDRWVTMSHMYYWAQEFKRLYPNEVEVYYETDDFICYRVRQNEYSLFNFAVDYGYNRVAENN